jgi:hypothetical protein
LEYYVSLLFIFLLAFVDVFAFDEVETFFSIWRLASSGKALHPSTYTKILGWLAAGVLRQACLILGLKGK